MSDIDLSKVPFSDYRQQHEIIADLTVYLDGQRKYIADLERHVARWTNFKDRWPTIAERFDDVLVAHVWPEDSGVYVVNIADDGQMYHAGGGPEFELSDDAQCYWMLKPDAPPYTPSEKP